MTIKIDWRCRECYLNSRSLFVRQVFCFRLTHSEHWSLIYITFEGPGFSIFFFSEKSWSALLFFCISGFETTTGAKLVASCLVPFFLLTKTLHLITVNDHSYGQGELLMNFWNVKTLTLLFFSIASRFLVMRSTMYWLNPSFSTSLSSARSMVLCPPSVIHQFILPFSSNLPKE